MLPSFLRGHLIRIVVLCAALPFLPACSNHPEGLAIGNLPPQIRLTGGPRDDTRDVYKARVYWSGWDDDGAIVRYEYALDPPAVFSRDEIAAPEQFPEITIRRKRGPAVNRDTLRVTKVVEGIEFGFDWIQTQETDRVFLLSTTAADSSYKGSQLRPDGTSSGQHAIYVRCMDNEERYSDIDRLAFTAWSYAPTAWISFPHIKSRSYLTAGGRIKIAWYGLDPDPPKGNNRPAGYYYKLVDLKSLDPPLSAYRDMNLDDVFYRRSSHIPWIYQDADTSGIVLYLEPSEYVFAVRAVDASGAVEPFLDFFRGDFPGNAFKFVSNQWGGIPVVTIDEPTLGTYLYQGSTRTQRVEVALGVPLRFQWSGSASAYGGKVEAYSWGLDIVDLDKDGPGSGWSPWGGSITNSGWVRFKRPGIHVLYVRARDSAGSIQTASLLLDVFEMPFDREVLFIDDYRNHTHPLDRQHDAWWDTLFESSERFTFKDLEPGVWRFDTGGESDRNFLKNKPPKLSQMGRYKLLVWNVHGDGWCGNTGFFQAAVTSPALRSYLFAGGQLWVQGPLALAATVQGVDCNSPDRPFYDPRQPTYPAADTEYPLGFEVGDFAFDILRIASDRIDNDIGVNWENTLVGVEPIDPENPIFETMMVDSEKFHPRSWEERALTHVEAVIDPVILEGLHENPGAFEPVYGYIAANEVRPVGRNDIPVSPFRDKICATRWHDPDPDPEHGRVMWFGFPLYFFEQEGAQDTFNRAIDWFREETIPAGRPERIAPMLEKHRGR